MNAIFTVLCVGEAPVLLTIRVILESAGFRVLTALSSAEALKSVASERIHTAVRDYAMPLMNGPEAARLIVSSTKSTCCVGRDVCG